MELVSPGSGAAGGAVKQAVGSRLMAD